MKYEFFEESPSAKIKVFGVGGAGGNAINNMIAAGLKGVDFKAANTDKQALDFSSALDKLQLGPNLTNGLGAGADPERGELAAEESVEGIRAATEGADMIFIIAGMGGGTGTGASPVIARECKSVGALTVAVVTKPFDFEGEKRMKTALSGIEKLKNEVDTLLIIPNERIRTLRNKDTTFLDLMEMADDVLLYAVKGISDLITVPGFINLDFADIKRVLKQMGTAIMGTGTASGKNRAIEAARMAINSPLLEDISIDQARGVLINITGTTKMTLDEVMEASLLVKNEVQPDAEIIWGMVFDDNIEREVRVTVIATGLSKTIRFITGKAGAETEKPPVRAIAPSHERIEIGRQDDIWRKGYSIFISTSDQNERSSRLKHLRDQILKTKPHDLGVDLMNALWRLSKNIKSVPDYSSAMARLLEAKSSEYITDNLYNYYSFVSFACHISSTQDIGRIPTEILEKILHPRKEHNIAKIPIQMNHLIEIIQLLTKEYLPGSYYHCLKKAENGLSELTSSLLSEIYTPEVACLSYVINHWQKLITQALKISLSNLKCELASPLPIYMNRWNEVKIEISGGLSGEPFYVSAPVTQDYDSQLDIRTGIFQDSGTIITLRIKPYISGPATLLIQIENITFQIGILVLLENPFTVGVPIQSEEMFVGREGILDRVIRGIVAPRPTNFLITGRRRIGKTSLLYAIKRKLPKGALPVLISTEICGRNPREVCQALATEIMRALLHSESIEQSKIPPPDISSDDPNGSFLSWLHALPEKFSSFSMFCMVLLIDEALTITEWGEKVQSLLRYVFSSMNWIRGVLAGPPDIIERMAEDVSSPLYNIFTIQRLGPLDKKEAYDLLVTRIKISNAMNIENMFDQIYDYSGGIPFYIQAVGYELIENCFSDKLQGDELLKRSMIQAREKLETSYPVTLRKLAAEEKISIVSIARCLNPPESSARILANADLVEKKGEAWIIRAGIEREWVKKYTDRLLDSAAKELWARYEDTIDLRQLSTDLKRLRGEFFGSEEIADALTAASSAAEKGDGVKVIKCLGKVGQYTLDAATKIGTEVAAAAIKATYGL